MLTEQDLQLRRGRVTASTVAAFLGFHWYASPSSAWDTHTGRVAFPENDSMRLGEFLEPGLVKAVTLRLGWSDFQYPCPTILSEEFPWAAATPDVLSGKQALGIQIKNQNPHMKGTYKGSPGAFGPNDNICLPPYMLAQCQWEMMVTGARHWFFATYLGGKDLWIFNLWRDDAMILRLTTKAFEFWKQHLDPDGPQERPSDVNWNPRVGRSPAKRKLRGSELLNQPTPQGARK